MAENKKSFILYADLISTVDKLPDEIAGKLLKIILNYVNDKNPVIEDLLLQIAFEPIKQQLKRDLKKFEDKKERLSGAGSKSAALRVSKPQVYVLRLYNENEEFIKVGVTSESISRRYSSDGNGGGNLKYKFDVIYQHFTKEELLCKIESAISTQFSKLKYSPKVSFPGYTECYDSSCANEIVKFITTFSIVEPASTNSTDTDNVTVNVNDNVIKKEKEKSFPVMPKAEDVGELPELKVDAAIEIVKIINRIDVTKKQVIDLWKVFKIQNLTGKKYHPDLESVHAYFINWIKTQNIQQQTRAPSRYEPANTDYMLKKL